MGLHLVFLVVKLFATAIALAIQGSTGYDVSTSPSTFSTLSPMKGPPDHANRSNAPNPASQPDVLHPSPAIPLLVSPPVPLTIKGIVPPLSPITPLVFPPQSSTPPPLTGHLIVPSLQPSVPQPKELKSTNSVSVPVASATPPPTKLLPPTLHPIMPGSMLPSFFQAPDSKAPVSMPIVQEPDASPVLTPWPSIIWKGTGIPTAAPPNQTPNQFSSANPPPQKGSHSPASLPPTSQYNHKHVMDNNASPAPLSVLLPPCASSQQGPSISPTPLNRLKPHRKSRQRYHAPLPMNPDYPLPSPESHISPAPVPSPTSPSGQTIPFLSPKISPPGSSPRNPKMALPPPVRALPPPPPNEDCLSIACMDPQTNSPPGSPCRCVLPMQVGLRLSVALYTFFPLVSELAGEIAVGVFVKQSQVRIMGANAASQDPEKTIVLVDLVPLEEKFDDTTAYLIFQRFWLKQVAISTSLFGKSELIYVRYPGLPPSPPSSISIISGAPDSGHDNNGREIQPLGVDVGRRQHENGLSGSVVAIIVLSASMTVILCCAVAWVLLLKHRDCQQDLTSQATLPSLSKPSGFTASVFRSGPSSGSLLSFASSFATYTGSAKMFSSSDVEKATNNFNASKILGEGGFGRVYSGILEDGTPVAVKVLKRDDQQSGREFLAEVEMLSRLHHRNLVKLVGICIEERRRCLVYELIPNGSVESHLHGVDRLTVPLDWGSRMKIALGTARGLAYLHEDSSPGVIHRDFKSSNILLEHDFTPKVSDFGLARTALDEENRQHISTRVMGTFGYVAPEYAMTGHLLVKSDVYSYGVVLLELLTGRKPVDMSQPPGQEHLVTWARPLLASKEMLESIIDPSLGSDFPSDSITKVAAIASMCVQPEVSHRPFMGEVVQALKLVCNESDDTKELGSRSCSQDDLSVDMDARISANSGQLTYTLQSHSPVFDVERRRIQMPDLFGSSKMLLRQESGSFRRHSSSGPLRSGKQRGLWQKMRGLSGGTVSEHGVIFRLWPGSH